jgi:hypothetical protein
MPPARYVSLLYHVTYVSRNSFRTSTGRSVPAVTADEMRDIDRVAVEDIGIPRTVYDRLGIEYQPPFGDDDCVRLEQ